MADTRSRGGKKRGRSNPRNSEQRQTTGKERTRPAKGQAGGPKPSAGKSRAQKAGLRPRKRIGAFPATPEMMPIT